MSAEDRLSEGEALEKVLLSGGKPQPYTPPWIRLFLEAGASSWVLARVACRFCGEPDLVFSLTESWPSHVGPEELKLTLCLRCGALEIVEVHYFGRHRRLGGIDWAQPDSVIDDARQLIRHRDEEGSTRDEFDDWLFGDDEWRFGDNDWEGE